MKTVNLGEFLILMIGIALIVFATNNPLMGLGFACFALFSRGLH